MLETIEQVRPQVDRPLEPQSETEEREPTLIRLPSAIAKDESFFEELCSLNRDLSLELSAEGDLVIVPPTFTRTGNRNFNLAVKVGVWIEQDGTGVGFDSSTGFTLPNGAIRSPDVAWITRERLESLAEEQRQKFIPLCPDFVIELRSTTDRLRPVQDKMREYIANGARLGWLIDASTRSVHIYRADGSIEILKDVEQVAGDPVLPGFTLDLLSIWQADF